jgi:FkbM family methyltransferase
MIRSDAKSWPPHPYRGKFHRWLLDMRQRLVREIEVTDRSHVYRFGCETVREFNRCLKLFSKEPGTSAWITSEVKPGQVFYDIGANIGVYTILAARQAMPNGKVYAFEPHAANFARLIDNVIRNSLQGLVVPCSIALDSDEGLAAFTYDSPGAGTSRSQFSAGGIAGRDARGEEIAELKYATTVDRLWETGRIEAPQHVKIDVDGNEHRILQGMIRLLESPQAPLTLQVEMNAPHSQRIRDFLQARLYNLSQTHYTRSGLRRMRNGPQSADSGYNALFRKK